MNPGPVVSDVVEKLGAFGLGKKPICRGDNDGILGFGKLERPSGSSSALRANRLTPQGDSYQRERKKGSSMRPVMRLPPWKWARRGLSVLVPDEASAFGTRTAASKLISLRDLYTKCTRSNLSSAAAMMSLSVLVESVMKTRPGKKRCGQVKLMSWKI